MTLKFRLALVVVLLMAALVACYSLSVLGEVRERAEAETRGAMPWVIALLPDRTDALSGSDDATARRDLAALMGRLSGIRHVHVSLYDAAGHLLASAPSARQQHVPRWLERETVGPNAPVRKDVRLDGRVVAYFEVSPATSDELAELWEDFLRSALLIVTLSLIAASAIVLFTFKSLQPLDHLRNALREIGAGRTGLRLPRFKPAEMDDIAQSFNRMAEAIETARREQTELTRRLVDGEERTRRALAHDLHDELSPYLVALQPLTRLLEMRCAATPGLADLTDSVRTLAGYQSRILTTLRDILTGLHPPELAVLGLEEALRLMAAQRAEMIERPFDVDLRIQADLRACGPTVDISLYRMVQECVTNAQRHSSASKVTITLTPARGPVGQAGWLQLESVNACAADAGSRSAGLGTAGMRQRTIALGGSFEAGPAGGRWRVRICIPNENIQEMEEAA
jgi:two-component system sensor histidine kinase UhpB